MATTVPRVLLVVAPRMLRDALMRVLNEVGSDAVSVRSVPGDVFDAAIVTTSLPAHAQARVVVRLPRRRAGPLWEVDVVDRAGRHVRRDIDGLLGLMQLLDEYVPITPSRAAGLAAPPASARS